MGDGKAAEECGYEYPPIDAHQRVDLVSADNLSKAVQPPSAGFGQRRLVQPEIADACIRLSNTSRSTGLVR